MSTVHRSAARTVSGAVLASAVVSGCAVGPDYRAPELTVPARYSESGVHASAGTSLAEWWRVFHDAPLDRLVARAIDANLDLRIAEARVRESRALWGIARSALWPTVDGSAAYSRTRQSENGPLGEPCGAASCLWKPISTKRRWMRAGRSTSSAGRGARSSRPRPRSARPRRRVATSWSRSSTRLDRATSSCAACSRS
jgi:Outer membrane efflux protein